MGQQNSCKTLIGVYEMHRRMHITYTTLDQTGTEAHSKCAVFACGWLIQHTCIQHGNTAHLSIWMLYGFMHQVTILCIAVLMSWVPYGLQ